MSAKCGELSDVTRSILTFLAAGSLTFAVGAGVSSAQTPSRAATAGTQGVHAQSTAAKPLPPGAATDAQAKPYFQFLSTYCEK
jgi:hypothetical protein